MAWNWSLEELRSLTARCLGREAAEALGRCMSAEPPGFVEFEARLPTAIAEAEAVLRIPCSQAPEAWVNMLHVTCLDDYMLRYLEPPRGVVVDAGAYLGFFTIVAASSARLVIAVEPNPRARRFLYWNLEANRLEGRVRVDPRMLCGSSGAAVLRLADYWAVSSARPGHVGRYGYQASSALRIPCVTLSQLLRSHGVGRADLVKLDIEGLEGEVLASAERDGLLTPAATGALVVELHTPLESIREPLHLLARLALRGPYSELDVNKLSEGYGQLTALLR